MDDPDIVDFEYQGWQALSSDADQARAFYSSVLSKDAQMLFPGEMRLIGRSQILEMIGGMPWQSFEITEPKVVVLSDAAQAVTYKVVAQREGQETYRAIVCSTYASRDAGWQLVVHQQTPA